MPSTLGTKSNTQLFYKRQAVKKLGPSQVTAMAPWRGYEPNVRATEQSWQGFSAALGIIPIGDYLQTEDGFLWVDRNDPASGTLALGSGALPSANPQAVTMVSEFTSSNIYGSSPYILAMTGWSTTGAGRLFYRLNATASWTAAAAAGTAPDNFGDSDGSRLYDWDVFTPGAPGRVVVAGAVAGPILVMCNGYDAPAATRSAAGVTIVSGNPPTYTVLTDELLAGGVYFRAATCCTFQDRMLFGATRENNVPCPVRVRWSKVGDCSKITAASPGAGAVDLIEFTQPIQRIMVLGDVVAVYSGDGVCFLKRTLRVTDPFQRSYVSLTRGLLAPQAVCEIGRNMHFGIFTDGWYILTESGEWNRVGQLQSDGATGVRWDELFYSTLNYARRSQVAVGYDAYRQQVRITFPQGVGSTKPTATWILDLKSNTVWPSGSGAYSPTCFATAKQVYASTLLTWATITTKWSTETGFWSTYDAKTEDIPAPIWGTSLGMVYQTSYASVLQGYRLISGGSAVYTGGVQPTWLLQSHVVPVGEIGTFATADELWINYEDQGPSTVTLGLVDADGDFFGQARALGGVAQNRPLSAYVNMHQALRQAGWNLSGTGIIKLRSIRGQFITDGGLQVRPQT